MNAVIYARYSSHGQTEQSIEGQLHDGYDFALREGYTIIGEYIDRAMTGRNDNRADFQRMLSDASKRQFQAVIVWKLDRFARNRYDSAINKAKLKKYGVRVVSVMENITDSPEGIILEGMLESMAEYYSANLSVNIKRGQRETLAKGKFTGGRVPIGYKCKDGRLIVDERTAPTIRYVFEQYAAGTPKKEIIDALNEQGVTGFFGGNLNISAFQRALLNPVYVGQFTRCGQVIEGVSQPIVSQDVFDKVQERLKTTKRAPAAKKALVQYLLQGKAFCGHCGARMVGESGRGKCGDVYHYYACSTKKKVHACPKKNEKKDYAEWYVVEQTVRYVLSPKNIEAISHAVVEEYNKEFSDERIKDLERASARLDKELDSLVDSITEMPKSARPRISAKMEAIEIQKADIDADIAKLRIARGISFTEVEVAAWMRQFCKGDPMDEIFRRNIIDVFINSVYFYDNCVIIFYNIRGGKQVSYTDLTDALTDTPTSGCSDFNAYAPPNAFKSEPRYIFVNGVFGVIFPREEGR